MHRRAGKRSLASGAALAMAFGVVWVAPHSAEGSGSVEPALAVEAVCDPLPGPGKVHCTVRERSRGGTFRWGDVIVLSAPSFAPALRTRASAGDASRRDSEGADFAIALAAKSDGAGDLRVLARAVVCGATGCRPVRAEALAKVVVGAEPPL